MTKSKLVAELLEASRLLEEHLDGIEARLDNSQASSSADALSTFALTLNLLQSGVGQSHDVQFRKLGYQTLKESQIVYVSTMANPSDITSEVLKPLSSLEDKIQSAMTRGESEGLLDMFQRALPSEKVTELKTETSLTQAISQGNTVLLLDGYPYGFSVSTAKPKTRSVGKTTVENVLRGPMDAFTEDMSTNLSLIRERIHDEGFRVEEMTIGRGTKTKVSLVSLENRVNPSMLAQLKVQLAGIDVDAIVDSGQISQLLHPGVIHIFPVSIATERPDRVVMGLFDGRIAVVVDTSPFILLLPSLYVDFFQAMEDLYMPWVPANAFRLLRLISDHVAVLAPALYLVVAGFNPGVVIPQFELTLASSRALVPYSPLIEMLLALVLTDILVEATIRSPKVVGNAIPIVGGIIIGDVLAKTHLASEVALIAGALSAITQFTGAEPTIQNVLRADKYWFLLWAGLLGAVGLMIATTLQLGYMTMLESLGVPYFSPVAPFRPQEAFNAKLVLPPRWRPRQGTKRNF